jgi:hypothetical protein
MTHNTVSINRAPVLTLWAAVVAERLGFDEDEALSLGRAVAALNAQSKGRRLGIFNPADKEAEKPRPEPPGQPASAEVCGRTVLGRKTPQGVRAALGGQLVQPGAVRKYLERAFGADLAPVRSALKRLAGSYDPASLRREAYALYEQFRPEVAADVRGWGARGDLDLGLIRRLAQRHGRQR